MKKSHSSFSQAPPQKRTQRKTYDLYHQQQMIVLLTVKLATDWERICWRKSLTESSPHRPHNKPSAPPERYQKGEKQTNTVHYHHHLQGVRQVQHITIPYRCCFQEMLKKMYHARLNVVKGESSIDVHGEGTTLASPQAFKRLALFAQVSQAHVTTTRLKYM